ncbi:phage tail tape measure protein [Neobittarella massiliensis]|uniref:Phage tail tape measure protein n=1 Tax=Neobittarella massiliensis (ex Bilen et al. 2018) TaxID=2041842 RepID=A0A8J6LUT9_9FIRM|nr:phage tail tape measure protein [Neobittarella massiliensis]MBC3516015.1 phage tail tape measure protein [Neobittarella massiliensis]
MSALTGGIELAPLLTRIAVDLDSFKTEMEKAKQTAKEQADGISQQIKKAAQVGQDLQKVGGTLTKAITVPLMGAGAASAKFAMDFQKDMAQVKTLLDGNAQQVEARTRELSENVLQVSNDVNMSSSQIAEGTYQVISAYGDSAETMDLVTIAAKGAKAGGAELVDSVNLLSAVTKGYGDTSAAANEKVSDLAFQTVKLGQTTYPELAASMGRVVPLAATLKVSQEELFGVMATGTGVTGNAAEVSTQLRGVLQALMAPTDSMAELMANLGYESGQAMIEGLGLQGTIDAIVKAADESGMPLQSYIGSIEGQTLALTLSGEQSDVLREKIAAMGEATGSAAKAFKAATENEAEDFDSSINKLKNSAIAFGDALTPLISKVADLVSGVADFINDLSPAQKEMAVNFALVAAAAGPAISAVGKGITTFSNVAGALKGLGGAASTAAGAGGLGSLSPAIGGVLPSLGGLVSAALPVAAAVGGIAVVGGTVAHVLSQEVVPEVDFFKSAFVDASGNVVDSNIKMGLAAKDCTVTISEETKKAVGAYMEMDESIRSNLLNLKINGTTITTEMTTGIAGDYHSMVDQVVAKIDEGTQQSLQVYEENFVKTGLVTQEQYDSFHRALVADADRKKQTLADNEAKITEIMQTHVDENGTLTDEGWKQINQILDESGSIAIGELSGTVQESELLMNRWKTSGVTITADMAAEQVQLLNDERDAAIDAAYKKKEETLATAEQWKKSENDIIRANGYKLEQLAEHDYEVAVDNAEKIRKDGLDKLEDGYHDLYKNVDTDSGKIYTWWGKLKKWWKDNTFEEKDMSFGLGINVTTSGDWSKLEYATSVINRHSNGNNPYDPRYSHYTGLDYVPYDGYTIRAHKGERLLTAEENKDFMQNKNGPAPDGEEVAVYTQINLDGKEIGYAVAPHVSVQQARNARRIR